MNETIDIELIHDVENSVGLAVQDILADTSDSDVAEKVRCQWELHKHSVNWPWCCHQLGDPDNFTVALLFYTEWSLQVRTSVQEALNVNA